MMGRTGEPKPFEEEKPRIFWIFGTPKSVINQRRVFGNFLANEAQYVKELGEGFQSRLKEIENGWNRFFHSIHRKWDPGTLKFTKKEQEQADSLWLQSTAAMLTYEKLTGRVPVEIQRGISPPLKDWHIYAPLLTGIFGLAFGFGVARYAQNPGKPSK